MPSISSFKGPYRWLSNFYRADVRFAGQTWKTAEHAFQASKTRDPGEREAIWLAETPGKAKRLGRTVKLRSDWETGFKLVAMRRVIMSKFRRNPELAVKLVATYPDTLIEGNTWGDSYWGCTPNEDDADTWLGHNMLGRLLMLERDFQRILMGVRD